MGGQEVPRDDLVHRAARRPPGALARVAQALADRGVNITGIVGVAEDTDGALMLTTSDADATREAFAALGHRVRGARPDQRREPTGLSIADIVAGRSG